MSACVRQQRTVQEGLSTAICETVQNVNIFRQILAVDDRKSNVVKFYINSLEYLHTSCITSGNHV